MSLPLGLIAKGFAGVCCVGTAAAGSGAFMSRGNWTELDEEIYKASGTWEWKNEPEGGTSTTATAGQKQELKIIGKTTTNDKTGQCTISGTVPEDATGTITLKISEQLTKLKEGLGVTNGGSTGQPSNSDKGKKFFDKCIESRTYSEWWEARKGTEAKSTINIKIENTSDGYKYNETEFNKLYTVTPAQ